MGSRTTQNNKTTKKQNKPPPTNKHKTPKLVQDRSWWKGETSSGSHVCLQLTPALTSSSAGNSQGPLQYWRLCARRSILYLLPLFHSASWYILLASKKLYRDNMFFLPDLVIDARKDSFLTRKLQWGTRLTKPKETVPGRRPDSPGMPIVFFGLMPCTLEALTVIKTFCLWLAIPTSWRIGESKKPGVFQIKTKQTQPKTKQKHHRKTPGELGETLRFQNK